VLRETPTIPEHDRKGGRRLDGSQFAAVPPHEVVPLARGPVLAERAQVAGEVARVGQGGGVVVAEQPAAASQGVLVEFPGGPVLAERVQVGGEVFRCPEGVGMVGAEEGGPPVMQVGGEGGGGGVGAADLEVFGDGEQQPTGGWSWSTAGSMSGCRAGAANVWAARVAQAGQPAGSR
jgi:hypothetical protein